MINVILIRMLADNFCYYVYHESNFESGFYVDVAEPDKLKAFIHAYSLPPPQVILTTHKHADHSGANKPLFEEFPGLRVYGGALDSIPGCTNPVTDEDVIEPIPGLTVRCMHTPCHTKGHILYYLDTKAEGKQHEVIKDGKYQHVKGVNRCIFTGDTIFLGGCGRFFEGTADQMLSAFDRFSTLPDDTKVFCGHEYTLKNLEFGLLAEGEVNPHLKEFSKTFQA